MGKKIGTLLLSLVILFLTIAAPECQAQVADLQSKYQAVALTVGQIRIRPRHHFQDLLEES